MASDEDGATTTELTTMFRAGFCFVLVVTGILGVYVAYVSPTEAFDDGMTREEFRERKSEIVSAMEANAEYNESQVTEAKNLSYSEVANSDEFQDNLKFLRGLMGLTSAGLFLTGVVGLDEESVSEFFSTE